MTKIEDWAAADAAMQQYNAARYYDYLLGGYHNFAVDRKVGEFVIQACPDVRLGALANRAFLRRAVKFISGQGVDQFLDLGSGIPTSGNVHEVAEKLNPAARVVYVDLDPIAVTHSQSILKDDPNAAIIQEDVQSLEKILDHPTFTGLIDLKRPLGVLMLSILHFIKNEEKLAGMLEVLRQRLVPGSYMAISHYTDEGAPPETIAQLNRLVAGAGSLTVARTQAEITGFFDGYELIEPGVVYIPLWRPESPEDVLVNLPEHSMNFAGVGRKR
jgi:hypothetical protein